MHILILFSGENVFFFLFCFFRGGGGRRRVWYSCTDADADAGQVVMLLS